MFRTILTHYNQNTHPDISALNAPFLHQNILSANQKRSYSTSTSQTFRHRMWAGVCALFWKNWRVKQRDSTLFKFKNKGRDRWILPPLLADVVLPISFLFYIISLLCSYNLSLTQSIPDNNESLLQGIKHTNANLSYQSLLLMTALPFTLEKANQSIWIIQNNLTTEFIRYLER